MDVKTGARSRPVDPVSAEAVDGQRFRAMAEIAPAMMWMTDPQGACRFLSRDCLEFIKLQEPESLNWLSWIHPDDHATVQAAFLNRSGAPADFSVDCRARHAGGEYRWLMMSGRPRFIESGDFVGYIGTFIDIDDRKRVQWDPLESTCRHASLSIL